MPSIADVPETHRVLLESHLTAVLTTIDAQGRPQSTAVWYLLRDDELIVSVTDNRQKYKNLAANPHSTLFIIDPANSMRTLEIRAEVELVHDVDKTDVATIAIAYGADPEQIKSMPGERYTVKFTPRRIVVNPPA
ncbi:MAG TPA: TIGR03618 family F420-dependent PPOX class oxidoreductase [Actinocrinis sp.]|nr:TIGR03618 family F420-dependent PPOX class oxidoreductase [Actinocrinis sp.]